MRFSRLVRASDSQCRNRNCPGFDPSIHRHSGIGGAADETVLKTVHKKTKKSPFKKIIFFIFVQQCPAGQDAVLSQFSTAFSLYGPP
jgi:hypothetical protein